MGIISFSWYSYKIKIHTNNIKVTWEIPNTFTLYTTKFIRGDLNKADLSVELGSHITPRPYDHEIPIPNSGNGVVPGRVRSGIKAFYRMLDSNSHDFRKCIIEKPLTTYNVFPDMVNNDSICRDENVNNSMEILQQRDTCININ